MDGQKLYSWDEENKQKQQQDMNINVLEDPQEILEAKNMLDTMNQQDLLNQQDEQNKQVQADPALMDKREELEENMPPSLSAFSKKQSLIRSAKYTFLTSKGEKVKGKRSVPSQKYMKPVLDNLKKLDGLLSKKIDLAQKEEIQNGFKDVIIACEKYLENRKNPWTSEGKARKQMVQDFYTEVRNESIAFETRVDELESARKQRAKKPQGQEAENAPAQEENRTWLSILSDVRTQKLEKGVNGVTVTMGGAGTSKVYIIEKDGKKQYFKENEKMPPKSLYTNIGKQIDQIRENKDEVSKRRAEYLGVIRQAVIARFMNDQKAFDFFNENPEPGKLLAALGAVLSGNKAFMDVFIKLCDEKTEHEEGDTDTDYDYVEGVLIQAKKDSLLNGIAASNAYIKDNEEISKRNVATSRLAKFLHIDDMVAKSVMTDLKVDGKQMHGIAMEDAKGKDLVDTEEEIRGKKRKMRYTSTAYRQLMNLQIFDIICGQVDRNAGNYVGQTADKPGTKETEITNIKAIDNDLCFGTLDYGRILKTGKDGFNQIRNIEVKGQVTMPNIDAAFADRILALEAKEVDYLMCDLLSKEERKALIGRIEGVKKTLRKQKEWEAKMKRKNPQAESVFVEEGKENWEKAFQNYSNKIKIMREKDRELAKIAEREMKLELAGRAGEMTKNERKDAEIRIRKKVDEILYRTDYLIQKNSYLLGLGFKL